MYEEILDPEIEILPYKKLYDNVVIPKLKKQLRYVLSKSDFYKKKIKLLTIKDVVEDFGKLPFTEKSEIILDQKKKPPFGSNICVDISKIRRIHRTAGTTGKPVFLALTKNDIKTMVHSGKRCFWSSGLRPDDIVIHCLNYCLWMGGFTDHQSLEATGATVVPYGVGNSINLINTILDLKPAAIHCTPSYLSRLELILKEEFNLEPSELGLKKGFFGAESGLQNIEFRNRIEKKWKIRAMNANYGLSDVHSMFGAECSQRNGLHFMGQEYILVELIDPETEKTLPLKKGVRGELVLTNLEKESQPLIRFRTHDVAEILDTNPCDCGRTSFRFKVLGRSDEMLVVKGINVFPEAIGDVLSNFLEVLSGEFQIIAPKKEPIEKITINVEMNADLKSHDLEKLRKKMLIEIQQKLNISPIIYFVEKGEFPRTDGKTKRLIRI